MKPGDHKTVQARILKYAEATGWKIVSQSEAEKRRGFVPKAGGKDRAKGVSLFFDDLFHAITFAFDDDGLGMVQETIEQG